MTMKPVAIFFLYISFIFNNEAYGYDECMKKFKTCFQERNCESRVIALDEYCCKQAFEDRTFNKTLEEECLEDRMLTDSIDCIDDLDSDCSEQVTNFFEMNMDTYDEIEKNLYNAIRHPIFKENCKNHAKQVEIEECLMCSDKDDDDEIYGWMCDLIRSTRTTLYCTTEKKCMNMFSTCMVRELRENQAKKIDVECCKAVINESGDFFKNKDNCAEKPIVPLIIKCLFEKEYCERQIGKYFIKNEVAIKSFDENIKQLVGVPKTAKDCDQNYEDSKRMMLEECQLNKDKTLTPFCELMEMTLDSKEDLNFLPDDVENNLKK